MTDDACGHEAGQNAHVSRYRLNQAFRVVAGSMPSTRAYPFSHPEAHEPGRIDVRVILQTAWWYDIHAVRHRVEDMSREYRSNVLGFLVREAPGWVDHAMAWTLLDALVGAETMRETARRLDLLDLLTPGWTGHTPLGRRLHELNGTSPQGLRPPPALVCARDSDHPDVLRDEDTGCWRITTESTSTYTFDLDRRRLRRDRGSGTAASNGGPTMRVNALPDDGAWTDLTVLIQCRRRRPLVAIDRRAAGEGYRLSTSVTRIERLRAVPT